MPNIKFSTCNKFIQNNLNWHKVYSPFSIEGMEGKGKKRKLENFDFDCLDQFLKKERKELGRDRKGEHLIILLNFGFRRL